MTTQCVANSNLCYCGPSFLRVIDQFPPVWFWAVFSLLSRSGQGRLSVILHSFHFLTIAPKVDLFSPNCLPFVDWLVPILCRCTILSLVSIDNSAVLALVERLQPDCLRVWTDVFHTDNEFKQVPLILLTSGQKSVLMEGSVMARILPFLQVLNTCLQSRLYFLFVCFYYILSLTVEVHQ